MCRFPRFASALVGLASTRHEFHPYPRHSVAATESAVWMVLQALAGVGTAGPVLIPRTLRYLAVVHVLLRMHAAPRATAVPMRGRSIECGCSRSVTGRRTARQPLLG